MKKLLIYLFYAAICVCICGASYKFWEESARLLEKPAAETLLVKPKKVVGRYVLRLENEPAYIEKQARIDMGGPQETKTTIVPCNVYVVYELTYADGTTEVVRQRVNAQEMYEAVRSIQWRMPGGGPARPQPEPEPEIDHVPDLDFDV